LLALLPLQGDSPPAIFPKGVALGYELIAPSGRYLVIADNLFYIFDLAIYCHLISKGNKFNLNNY